MCCDGTGSTKHWLWGVVLLRKTLEKGALNVMRSGVVESSRKEEAGVFRNRNNNHSTHLVRISTPPAVPIDLATWPPSLNSCCTTSHLRSRATSSLLAILRR